MNLSSTCLYVISVVLVVLFMGCASFTPIQLESGQRMAQRMAVGFETPIHEPFFLSGGSNAVLFVHGYPGSPAQMRPMAEALHAKGWTVQGLLIPGSGKDMGRLASLNGHEWTNAIRSAVVELAQNYERVLVVAYSMGAAMTCASLKPGDIDGLVLIAPYQWKESASKYFVWTILRPFMPDYYQPFRKIDLTDPEIRARLTRYFPHGYLDQPEYQEEVRSCILPIALIANLRSIVRSSFGPKWVGSNIPILVLQGSEDTVAEPLRSRELATRWAGRTRYEEFVGDHLAIETTSPALPSVITRLCFFVTERAAVKPIRSRITHKTDFEKLLVEKPEW